LKPTRLKQCLRRLGSRIIALVKRNPAIRTWVQLHAFQPLVLQQHEHVTGDTPTDFSIKTVDSEGKSLPEMLNKIDVSPPLTKFRQNDSEWLATKTRLTWALAGKLERPGPKNPPYSELDAETFDLFRETLDFCDNESINACLCEGLNAAADGLRNAAVDLGLVESESWPLQGQDKLACEVPLSPAKIENLLKKLPKMLEVIDPLPVRETRRGVYDHAHELMAEAQVEEKLTALDFLSHVQKYQNKFALSWPLIYSSLLQDINMYVLDQYWDPTAPIQLGSTHASTIAVNAVRGKAVEQLKTLSEHDLNPGPLLHFIQDIHSHGPFNTYNGHALVNHSPDFIGQDAIFNAVNASIDTIIVLCEFKDFFENPADSEARTESQSIVQKHQNKDQENNFFVGRRTFNSELCGLANEDEKLFKDGGLTFYASKLREYITTKSLTGKGSGPTLKDILVELGQQSKVPSIDSSKVTAQGIQKLLNEPPHFIDGNESTTWTNEQLGLPDFPAAVHYLSKQVTRDLIPIWRNNQLRLEDFLFLEGLPLRNLEKHREAAVENLPKWHWPPSKIPTSVIQYDYDYCARALSPGANWPTAEEINGDWAEFHAAFNSVVSCDLPEVSMNPKAEDDEVKKATKSLYPVENVSVSIENITIGTLVSHSAVHTRLTYRISGEGPGLDGRFVINLTKPKTYSKLTKGSHEEGWVTVPFPETSTDMFTSPAKIDQGPDHLPVFEYCQLLMAGSEKTRNDLDSIAKLRMGKKEQRSEAAGKLHAYIFRPPEPGDLMKLPILYNARRYQGNGQEPSSPVISDGSQVLDNSERKAIMGGMGTSYVACSVQVQGLPPVMALKKVPGFLSEFNFSKGTVTE
jgi:hypothetical protein